MSRHTGEKKKRVKKGKDKMGSKGKINKIKPRRMPVESDTGHV